MFAIVALGVLSYSTMNRALFPEYESSAVQVSVVYPGASAEEIESTICQRIEEEIESVQGVERVESLSQESVGAVTVVVEDTHSLAEVRADVQDAVDRIVNFPDLAEDPQITEIERMVSVVFGELFSTSLLLLGLPCAFSILSDFGLVRPELEA